VLAVVRLAAARAAREGEDGDGVTGGPVRGQHAAHADLHVIRMRADRQHDLALRRRGLRPAVLVGEARDDGDEVG
jgi:hypothetical protein